MMVILAKEERAEVVENARAAWVGRARRRRKEDILEGFGSVFVIVLKFYLGRVGS